MAIYRGAGGAGDAVADSSSEALLVRDLATQVTADAAAAEAAKIAAQAARAAAETAETNAETAETNAETAETNAETAQAAAASSASAAATSATNAANSATAAQTAETNAETAETNAAASASAASTSATNAASSASSASASASTSTTQATNASNSASAAATSATNASNSATAAATSASNAATSATSASNSASTATTQATNAANSATAAATSATNSANSATASASSATDSAASATLANDWATKTSAPVAGGEYSAKYHAQQSATSATNASNSASSAATSATNASNSATASASSASDAAASAAAAAASYDNFDDRYLGSKSSAPTLDNDGNALLTGALYYNNGTVTPADKGMYVYDGSQWIAASAASTAILTVYKFTATAGQTTFSGNDDNAVSLVYTAGSVIITLNGAVLEIPVDVAASTGTSVVLANAAVAGDELNIYAFATFNVANTYTQAQSDATFLTKSNPSYTGTFTGGTDVVNIGSGQVYKDASGNLGVGTSSPLSIAGYTIQTLNNGTSGSGTYYQQAATSIGRVLVTSSEMYVGSNGAYPLILTTNAAERMRIDSSGNVGIGTSSPAFQLHVSGANPRLQLTDTDTGADSYVSASSSNGSLVFGADENNEVASSVMSFRVDGSERMRIDSSGNLLVGTNANPWSTKIIGVSNGSGSFSFQPANTTTNFRVWGANTSSVYFDNSGSLNYTFSSGSGSSFAPITASAFNIGSDYRLKENITPLTAALSQVNKFKPVKFSYKENNKISMPWGTQVVDGFLAHEFAEVVPTAVTGKKDAVDEKGEMVIQTLDMTKAIPLLVAAIQEQQAIITDLKSRIETLESK